ncbi:CBO0543 family protein [Rossellomorea sp. NPDC071047]|uniref:CBO0543 family protein n=1 Tax=Rossellomorea sp. NPDC071047 TaxID=3390675 RepID=UPI003CFD33CD
MKQNLIVFFSKGVVSTLVDTYVVSEKRVAYPIRPFPGVFKTNIVFDMLFFPLLMVRQTYNDGLWKGSTGGSTGTVLMLPKQDRPCP